MIEVFRGLLNGPRVLKQVREAALTCPPEQTEQVVKEVLDANGYTLSKRQRQLWPETANLAEHRKAVAGAKALCHAFPATFKETVAAQIDIATDPNTIEAFVFNPSSITVCLKPEEFRRVWRARRKGSTPDNNVYPGGFYNPLDQITIGGRDVLCSFMDAKCIPGNIPQHEDLHAQYDHLHPEHQPALAEYKDVNSFRRFCDAITRGRMQEYLNELSAYAGSGEARSTHKWFWSHPLYYEEFQETLNKIQGQFPKDPAERFPYQAILDEYLEKLRYRTAALKDVFSVLEGQTVIAGHDYQMDRDYNVAFAQFLTVENGFAASAIMEGRAPQLAEARRWRNAPKSPRGILKVPFWTDAVLHTAEITSESPNLQYLKAHRIYQVLDTSFTTAMITRKNPDPPLTEEKITGYVDMMLHGLKEAVALRFTTIQKVLQSTAFTELPLSGQEQTGIKRQVLLKAVDFQKYFGFLLSGMHQSDRFNSRASELYRHYLNIMVEKSFSLEDAAETIAADLFTGENPDYGKIFEPGFKKSDERCAYLLACVESQGEVKIFDELPLEAAILGRFRMRMLKGLVEIREGEVIDIQEAVKDAASLFIRLLDWAHVKGLSNQETITTREYLEMLLKRNLVPSYLVEKANHVLE